MSIEDGALKLFVRAGYAGTSMRDIALAVGLSPGALYNHYPNKQALFRAVVARYREQFSTDDNPVRNLLTRSRFPFDIPKLAAAIRTLIATHRSYWLLWYVDVIEFDGVHFQSELAPHAVLGIPELKTRLDQIKHEDILTIDPNLAFVMVYMHLFNYYLIENLFRGKDHYGVDETTAVTSIADVFLRGMLKPGVEADQQGDSQ